jgi:hypothetical protein
MGGIGRIGGMGMMGGSCGGRALFRVRHTILAFLTVGVVPSLRDWFFL